MALDTLLAAKGRSIAHVIELVVDEELLVHRIVGGLNCAGCGAGYHDRFKPQKQAGICDQCGSTGIVRRNDDNETAIRSRLAEYAAKTGEVTHYYGGRSLLRQVDGMQPIDEVGRAINALLAPTRPTLAA